MAFISTLDVKAAGGAMAQLFNENDTRIPWFLINADTVRVDFQVKDARSVVKEQGVENRG
jgi:hypothetical protein